MLSIKGGRVVNELARAVSSLEESAFNSNVPALMFI